VAADAPGANWIWRNIALPRPMARNVQSCGGLAPGFVRLPVGFFGLAPIRVGLFIQEPPQREILVAGASSVKKLVDIRICGAPAGREI
jgi:hypothetical protein